MRDRSVFALVVLICLALAAGGIGMGVAAFFGSPRIYTVAELLAERAHHPRVWGGRTVQVAVTLMGGGAPCASCREAYYVLYSEPITAPHQPGLVVERAHPDPTLTYLRQVPLLGRVIPGPQARQRTPAGRYAGVFRLYLLPKPLCWSPIGFPRCADALVVDADAATW